LNQLIKKKGDKLFYKYDFGDSWRHELVLEQILEKENKAYLECITGKNACPLEDSGGVWGYMDMLAARADPNHESHDDVMSWMGEAFDPKAFDKDEVNKKLASY